MYLKWNSKTITDFSDANVDSLYSKGYLFTRKSKGEMCQTRSVRIDLSKFKLSSENRRVLKKTKNIELTAHDLPLEQYHWTIGKMAKDFYDTKFGERIFSANKVKELLTTHENNFNTILKYSADDKQILGYAICMGTNEILHYSYPFYNLRSTITNLGIGMMTKAIVWAQEQNNKKYVYLGSASRPTDTYKLQFGGAEWFDGKKWNENLEELKRILK